MPGGQDFSFLKLLASFILKLRNWHAVKICYRLHLDLNLFTVFTINI